MRIRAGRCPSQTRARQFSQSSPTQQLIASSLRDSAVIYTPREVAYCGVYDQP